MKTISISVLVILLAIPACSPLNISPQTDLPNINTIVAATMQALSETQVTHVEVLPTQTPQPSGIPINFENITIIIPNGLASGATGEKFPADPTDTVAGGWPAYIGFTLSSYLLQDMRMPPTIRIFSAEEFRLRDPTVNERMDSLKSILSNPNASLDKLPILPIQMAGPLIQAQTQVINFQNGSGIRYLTQFAQYPAIVSNHELFYNFIGLSQDGKYFISAVLPVNVAFLPADSNPQTVVPTGGIPSPPNGGNEVYYTAVMEKLNRTDPTAFSPSLPMLDALIQSVSIQ